MSTETAVVLQRLREIAKKTQEEVAEGTGSSQKLVSRHETTGKMSRLSARRYAEYYTKVLGVKITLDILDGVEPIPTVGQPTVRRIPILGTAPCGEPGLAEQTMEDYIELPGDIAPGAELAAIRIVGDSMQAAGLYDGQLAIIRLQEKVENGEIAVVCVGDDRSEATVKRYYNVDGYVTLTPAPADDRRNEFPPFSFPEEQVHVVGKVSGVWWG